MDINEIRTRGERTRRRLAARAFTRKLKEHLKDLRVLLFHQRTSWSAVENRKHKRRARPQEHPVITVAKTTAQKAKYIKPQKEDEEITQKSYLLRRLKEAHSE